MSDATLQFGPYEGIERLGQGGMGTVWLARGPDQQELVALKTVNRVEPKLLSRFRREIRTLKRLSHPGVIACLDEGVTPTGQPWYTMPLLRGACLMTHLRRAEWSLRADASQVSLEATTQPAPTAQDHWISRLEQLWMTGTLAASASAQAQALALTASATALAAKPWPEPDLHASATPTQDKPPGLGDLPGARRWPLGPAHQQILSWLGQLAMTLAYLHGEGVVHCDLKPENIFITQQGQVILLDFGIAEHFGARVEPDVLEAAGLQAGTAHYIAPEQLRGGAVDARTDLYSLGCILYQVLAGRVPFDDAQLSAILHHQLHTSPPLISRRLADSPPSLELGLARLLSKQPQHRLGHPQLVVELLRQAHVCFEPWPDSPPTRRFLYRPDFVGRAQLMSELEEHLEAARAGLGRALVIGGESGVGKSRLAAELLTRARSKQMLILHGQGQGGDLTSLASSESLHLFGPTLRHMADVCQARGPELTQAVFGPRGKVLEPYAPFLAALPGQSALPAPEQLPPEQRRARVFHAMTRALEAFCQREPMMWVLDDLHWADRLSLACLEHLLLAAQLSSKPWFILGLYRAEDAPYQLSSLLQRARVGALRLDRLAQEDVQTVISQMLGHPWPPEILVQYVHAQTEGNPFYVAEYLRLALEEGLLQMDERGVWTLRPAHERIHIEQLHTPRAVQALITERLERLPQPALQVCQAATILGKRCHMDALQAVSQQPPEALLSWIDLLARREILTHDEREAQPIGFVHDKLREVTAAHISPSLASALHARAAAHYEGQARAGLALPSGLLGHHLALGGQRDRAVRSHLADARRALAESAHGQAGRLLERALALETTLDAEQLQLALDLAEHTWLNTGEHRAAHEHMQRIDQQAKALDLPLLRARAQQLLGELLLQRRQDRQAERALREASARYERYAFAKGQADVLIPLARLAAAQGRGQEARACAEQAYTIYRRHKHARGQARALHLMAELCAEQLRLRESVSTYELALEHYERLQDRFNQSDVLTRMSQVLYELGHLKQAAHHAARALKLARQISHQDHEARCLLVLGATALERQQHHAALKHLEAAARHLHQLGPSAALIRARALQCRAHRLLGELHHAQQMLDRAELLLDHEPALAQERAFLLIERVWLRLASRGSVELALRALTLHLRQHPASPQGALARALDQHERDLSAVRR